MAWIHPSPFGGKSQDTFTDSGNRGKPQLGESFGGGRVRTYEGLDGEPSKDSVMVPLMWSPLYMAGMGDGHKKCL